MYIYIYLYSSIVIGIYMCKYHKYYYIIFYKCEAIHFSLPFEYRNRECLDTFTWLALCVKLFKNVCVCTHSRINIIIFKKVYTHIFHAHLQIYI